MHLFHRLLGSRKFPARLKSASLVQFDAALSQLRSSAHIGLGLKSRWGLDGYISTRLVLGALRSVGGLKLRVFGSDQTALALLGMPSTSAAIALNGLGEAYVVQCKSAGNWEALMFDTEGALLQTWNGSWLDLKQSLCLLDECIVLISSSSNLHRSFKRDFVDAHFWALRREGGFVLGAALLTTGLGVLTPLGFQAFTDKILPFNASSSLLVLAIMLTIATFSTSVIECAHGYLESVMMGRLQQGLGREVLERLLKMPIGYFDSQHSGDITKLTTQVHEVAQFLVKQSLAGVISVLSLLVVVPLLLLYSTALTTLVLAIGMVMAFTVAVPLKAFQRRVTASYLLDADFQSGIIEMIKGIRTIKSLALERQFQHRIGARLENQLGGGFELERLGHVVRAVVNFESRIVTVLIIFVGAQAVFKGQMSVGQLIAFHMLADRLIQPLVSLVFTVNGWQSYRLAKRKLSELQPPEEQVLSDGELFDLDGDIEFDDVWFKYPSAEDFALKGVSFKIPRGTMVGIVGESGSGKSTVFGLLQGFYEPTKGRIRINGFDVRDIPKSRLCQQMAVVSQQSFLFNLPVFENVRLGRTNARMNEVLQAIDASGSATFVDALPGRYGYMLSEDGANLSGGQRQRIAIARALLRQAPIMLFDEATSALDSATETRIREVVKETCAGRTCLLIAHRIQTLVDCQDMILMANGEVIAHGSPDAVCTASDEFAALWKQVSRVDFPEVKL